MAFDAICPGRRKATTHRQKVDRPFGRFYDGAFKFGEIGDQRIARNSLNKGVQSLPSPIGGQRV